MAKTSAGRGWAERHFRHRKEFRQRDGALKHMTQSVNLEQTVCREGGACRDIVSQSYDCNMFS